MMKDLKDKFIIEVAGNKYVLSLEKVLGKPRTKLGQIAEQTTQDETNSIEHFSFDRPTVAFEAVQAYYQTDELHMPTNICPLAFKKELEFWEIEPCELHECCLFKFVAALDEFETTAEFQKSMKRDVSEITEKHSGSIWSHFKQRTWAVLQNEDHTKLSRIYLLIALFFVLLSITTLALSTVSHFRVPLDGCEKLELHKEDGQSDNVIDGFLQNVNCTNDMDKQWRMYLNQTREENFTGDDVIEQSVKKFEQMSETNRTKPHDTFKYINYVIDAFFTVELLIRLVCSPCLRKYFLSFLNVLDIAILCAAYTAYIVENMKAKYRYDEKGTKLLHYFEMLRVLRLLRVVQNLAAIRVLRFTLKANRKDLYVLGLYLFIGMVLFANFVFFAEDALNMSSIPEAWWWSVITMTTVGYGDVVPRTQVGRFIGVLCAVSGVLLLGLVVPMFINTFLSLYKVANLNERIMSTNARRKLRLCHKKIIHKTSIYPVKPNDLSKNHIA